MAFNNCFQCSPWRSFPVSVGDWEMRDSVVLPLLLILPDFLAYMKTSVRVRVKARMLHSDTLAACHCEQSHTVPTLQQRVGADSHSPHAGWQRCIHLNAVQSRDFIIKGALWARTEISRTLDLRCQQTSHSEKEQGGADKQGQLREQGTLHVSLSA